MSYDRRQAISKWRLAWATPLLLGVIGWAARSYDHSKLDSARFESDSINRFYTTRELTALLLRVDSNVKVIKATHR